MGAAGVPRNDVVQLTLWPLLEWSQMATRGVQALRGVLARWVARDNGAREPRPLDVKAQ